MSNFDFLRAEWPELHDEAIRVERLAVADPRVACFYARRTLELTVKWLYEADDTLRTPYQRDLAARIAEPTMVNLVGPAIRTKMDLIRRQGNHAVHRRIPVQAKDSVRMAVELFHVMYWLARNYARGADGAPPSGLSFDRSLIPAPVPAEVRQKKRAEIKQMAQDFARQQEELAQAQERNKGLDAEIAQLRAQIKEAKAANTTVTDEHDYDENETRTRLIDLLLHEAGWTLENEEDREYPLSGLPTGSGQGRADYVLWDDDGLPLAVVEAKRTAKDPRDGQQQARGYADALEGKFGRRPVIFYSNGYRTFLWDDAAGYPPRDVQGFYTKDELRSLVMRRVGAQALAGVTVNPGIAGRHYQSRAIRRITEAFEGDKQRQALLVMATGAGKTRTVIALTDLLNRAGWVKRVLFLADRKALVNQAYGAFKEHLPSTPVVNLLEEKDTTARVYVSTYPTMMGLINDRSEGVRGFGPGFFDLVVIDEAHRSVYQKYGAIFDHFDSLLVGLTATPKEEVDRNTYRLFNLEDGVPTDVYSLEEAVRDGYLVPPTTIDVPLKFPREGIKYDELSEEDKEAWELLDWDEDEGPPDHVSADDVDKNLFNADTIDKALQTLMEYGAKVEGGDRLGKTIVFARNIKHAHFVVDRFNALYPDLGGEFAQVITSTDTYAQATLDRFAQRGSAPHIAVSVDMLDTGVDIPEVVNLVFAKLVRSRTKFWQMLGRGTRLCRDLFGPGQEKKGFLVFDLGRNVEFFNQNIPAAEGSVQPSLRESVFRRRVELLHRLDRSTPERDGAPGSETPGGPDEPEPPEPAGEAEATEGPRVQQESADERGLRRSLAERLQLEVAGMHHDNVEVRRHLETVHTYQDPAAWRRITDDKRDELIDTVGPLPSQYTEDEDSQEAKRFDLLVLRLQLGTVEPEPGYDRLRSQVQEIAESLLDPTTLNNPVVARQRELLSDLVSDAWWQDVTLPMLEMVRRRLRGLVRLIPKTRKAVVYTDFEDDLGRLTETELSGLDIGGGWNRFETKVRGYLRAHADDLSVQKLLRNKQLTTADIDHFEQVFLGSEFGTRRHIERAEEQYGGLGFFLRSLTGLDRQAVSAAFDEFQSRRRFNDTALHFLKLIIDYVATNGYLDVGKLYEPPFTGVSPQGPEGVFSDTEVDSIEDILKGFEATATPAEAG